MIGRFLRFAFVMAVLLPSMVRADPSLDALNPIARNIYLEGLGLEDEGEYRRAAIRFRKVLELDPGWTRAALDLGRVLEADGKAEEAEQAYWLAPSDTDAVEALGRLYLAQQRFDPAVDAFRILQNLAPADANAIRLEVLALARVNATEAELRFREYLELPGIEVASVEIAHAAVVVSDALEEAGEEDTARTLLEDLRDGQGEEAEAAAQYSQRLDRLQVRQEARELAGAGAQLLSTSQRGQLAAARADKEPQQSLQLLEALVEQVPRSPEAWAALSVARESVGDVSGAEQAAWLATKLAPLESAHLIRYGDLLAGYHAGRLDLDAIRAYEKALSRQGSSAELWYRKGRLEVRSGQLEEAIGSFRRYVVLAPDGPHAKEVEDILAGYERNLPVMPVLPSSRTKPDGLSADAWLDFHVAMVYQLRQSQSGTREEDLGRALERLDVVLEVSPDFVPAINLRAGVLAELGDPESARQAYEESLRLDPDQPGLLVELAQLVRHA